LHASERLSDFRAGLSPTEHNAFKSLFKVKEMDDLQVVKAVMKSAFDIKVKGSTGNLRRKGFTHREFDNDKLEMDDRVQTNISNNGLELLHGSR
jgi:hypothetical protein